MTDGGEEPNVAASTAMTELLRSAGVTEAEIAEASRHNHLELLAIESLVMPETAHHNITEVSTSTGISTALIAQMWRSLGFAEPRPSDRIFTDVDVEMLRAIGGLLDMGVIDDALTMQMARVIGSSLARVASAVIDSVDSADADDEDAGEGTAANGLSLRGSEDFAGVAPMLLPTLLQVMDYVWRRHVQAAARARMASEQAGTDPGHRVVGFADLVGFTALSQQLSTHELAAVVDRFEGIAYDTVGGLGGRVVKMIGDEVMFSIPHERGAAEIALTLSETYRDDDELSDVRVGLAAGPVLQREADLFGPVVNLASRIVNIAFPGTVVCSAEVHDSLEGDVEYGWKSIGQRNLKDIGRVPLFVLHRQTAPVRDKTSREKAESRRSERREARVTEMADRRRRRRDEAPS